jgi:adenosine kinase
MTILVCGSLAFDTILSYEGEFAQHILPQSLAKLSVSFLMPNLRREFGGCAGNIAYNVHQLGGKPVIAAALGADGGTYLQRFAQWDMPTDLVPQRADAHTAQAIIFSDSKGNQITAFHPGAMGHAHEIDLDHPLAKGASIAIVGPDGKQAMQRHAQQLHANNIPWVFDPGQGLPMFDGAELRALIDLASWAIVNEYEAELMCRATGLGRAELSQQLKGFVVTLAERGCEVWVDGQCTPVAPVQAEQVLDPTGCGDAFRGALLLGLQRGMPLVDACAIGNRVGAIKVAHQGGQNHALNAQDLGF